MTYRAEEALGDSPLRPFVVELVRREPVVAVELEPLGRDDAGRQLETIAGRPLPASLVEELHVRSGGNPFFLEELFAARESAQEGAVPRSVADAVLLRIGRLDDPAARVLGLVAAAGGRSGFELLERLVAPGELEPAVRSALDAGLLVREPDDGGVCFRHALMTEVVYGELLPPERVRLHRAHRRGAGARARRRPRRSSRSSGTAPAPVTTRSPPRSPPGWRPTRVYAFSEARVHLERALELWDAVGRAPPALAIDKAELLSRAAQAARFTGDRSRAVELALEALGEIDAARDPVRAALLYERLGEHHFWDDELRPGVLRASARAAARAARPERARLLAAQGHALMGLRRLDVSRRACEAALAAAAEVGRRSPGGAGADDAGLVLAFLGDGAAGEAHVRRALELAEAFAPGEATARAYLHLGEVQRLRGAHAAALETMNAGERAAARLGMRESFGRFMYVNAIEDLLRLGRWDEAEQRIVAAERMDLGVTGAVMRHASAAHLFALRGEAARARTQLDQAAGLAQDGLPSEFVAPVQVAAATLALATGSPAEARGATSPWGLAAATDALYTPPLLWLGIRAEADIAERARALRRRPDAADASARAETLLAQLAALIATAGGDAAPPDARAHLALGRAELSRSPGAAPPAVWEAAVSAWDRAR